MRRKTPHDAAAMPVTTAGVSDPSAARCPIDAAWTGLLVFGRTLAAIDLATGKLRWY
jgi:hypothetical protein